MVRACLIDPLKGGGMPAKKRLTNIANGLCGSFISRNNDLDGYWAIGKLRSLADQHGQTTVVLDLLTSSTQPSSAQCSDVFERYCRLLATLAACSRIPFADITVARIALDFAPPPWPRASYYKLQWGDQFTVTVIIEADGRAMGMARDTGYCRPHDAARKKNLLIS
jgi:hypothetical protein